MKNIPFLDPSKHHTLTEQECELVTFYRSMSPTKQKVIIQALFAALSEEVKKKNEK